MNELRDYNPIIAVVGLGYVGLPLAVEFGKKYSVIGFDLNKEKLECYKKGIDVTGEVGDCALSKASVLFTSNENDLQNADFYIVAVPTPVNLDKTPDLKPVISASQIVGANLKQGAIVVYESTVYPGVTEDICIPCLEKASGMRCNIDFKVGYSPERINPGDQVHRLTNIKKIVSGIDEDALAKIEKIYSSIITAGVHCAPSIKVAEAAKVVENSQRDINIAFMNELAIVFDKMGIDTQDVISAMNTKWNALNFTPGLVGGHCIGVDPYYFIYEAKKLGYHSQIILPGRNVNDGMSNFIANIIVKKLVQSGLVVKDAKILIMGITFKENCGDTRNTRIVDIFHNLEAYGLSPMVVDPLADPAEVKREYGLELQDLDACRNVDCVVLAVAHDQYKALTNAQIESLFRACSNYQRVLIDIKGILDKDFFIQKGYNFWRL